MVNEKKKKNDNHMVLFLGWSGLWRDMALIVFDKLLLSTSCYANARSVYTRACSHLERSMHLYYFVSMYVCIAFLNAKDLTFDIFHLCE